MGHNGYLGFYLGRTGNIWILAVMETSRLQNGPCDSIWNLKWAVHDIHYFIWAVLAILGFEVGRTVYLGFYFG